MVLKWKQISFKQDSVTRYNIQTICFWHFQFTTTIFIQHFRYLEIKNIYDYFNGKKLNNRKEKWFSFFFKHTKHSPDENKFDEGYRKWKKSDSINWEVKSIIFDFAFISAFNFTFIWFFKCICLADSEFPIIFFLLDLFFHRSVFFLGLFDFLSIFLSVFSILGRSKRMKIQNASMNNVKLNSKF